MECTNCPFQSDTLSADMRQDKWVQGKPCVPQPTISWYHVLKRLIGRRCISATFPQTDLLVCVVNFTDRVLSHSLQVTGSWTLYDLCNPKNVLWERIAFSVKCGRMIAQRVSIKDWTTKNYASNFQLTLYCLPLFRAVFWDNVALSLLEGKVLT